MPMFSPDQTKNNNKIRLLHNHTTNNAQQSLANQSSSASCMRSLSMLLTNSSSRTTGFMAMNMGIEFSEPSPIPITNDALTTEKLEIDQNFVHIGPSHICIRRKYYPLTYTDPQQKTHQSCTISVNGLKLPLECNGYRLCYDWLYRRVSLGHTEPTPQPWSVICSSFVQIGGDSIYIRGKPYTLTYANSTQRALDSCSIRVNDDLTLPVEYDEYRLCYDWLYRKISLGHADPAPLTGDQINEILNGTFEDSSPNDSNQPSPNPVESYPDEKHSLSDSTQLSPNPVESYPDEKNCLSDSHQNSLSPVEGWLGEYHLFANRSVPMTKPDREQSVSESHLTSLNSKTERTTQGHQHPLQDGQSNNIYVNIRPFRF